MEYIHGITISDTDKLSSMGVSKKQAAALAITSLAEQIMLHGKKKSEEARRSQKTKPEEGDSNLFSKAICGRILFFFFLILMDSLMDILPGRLCAL